MAPRAPSPGSAWPPPSRPAPPRDVSTHSKASFISSQSNEADDERSISTASMMGEEDQPPPPRYLGEDTRLTSNRELSGFYMYGWAAEVFVVCGIGSFIPITLEQLARERGVLLSDRKTPCTTGFQPNAAASTIPTDGDSTQCIITFLGLDINTASFAMYTFSLSVLIQSLIIISMSGAADHGRYRKTFLLIFAFAGAIATMFFLTVTPKVYLLGALLAIISNTCIGASFVLLNSFLPLLVRHHPALVLNPPRTSTVVDGSDEPSFEDEDPDLHHMADSTTALLPSDAADPVILTNPAEPLIYAELELSTKISATGIGIGYIAAVLVQVLSILIVLRTGSTTFSLRLALFFIGSWWFVFTFPAAMWLRPRPGPPLNIGHNGKGGQLSYITYAWKSLGKSVVRARRLKDVLLFLAAWFLLSDAIATVSGTAVLFAKTSLEMKPAALAMINVVATLSGIIGAFSWNRLSGFMALRPHQTILACICLFEVIPIYGLLGYIPAVQRLGVIGLQQPWEMYPLGAVYGFVMGGLSSYCRSLFGELIPPGSEAAFYALYAITDKGSSVFGPAIVGAITDATGEIRPAFWFLAVLVGLPFPMMYMVDVERGKHEGAELARELGGLHNALDGRSARDAEDGPIRLVDEENDEEVLER